MKTSLFFSLFLVLVSFFSKAQMDDKFYQPKKEMKTLEFKNIENISLPVESDTITAVVLKPESKQNKKTIENLKFDTKLKSKEDWDFWIQFYTVSKKTYFINSNLVLYRINPNTLGTNIELIYIANEHIYKKYNSEIKSLLFTKLNNLNLELVKRNIFLSNNYLKIYNNKLFKIYNKIRSVIKR